MKPGDKIVYVGKTTKDIKKYSVCELILAYDDNRYLTFYNSESGFNKNDYDEEKILIRDKILFITLADYRKQKLEKIKLL